jgi:hypothetical protein
MSKIIKNKKILKIKKTFFSFNKKNKNEKNKINLFYFFCEKKVFEKKFFF